MTSGIGVGHMVPEAGKEAVSASEGYPGEDVS